MSIVLRSVCEQVGADASSADACDNADHVPADKPECGVHVVITTISGNAFEMVAPQSLTMTCLKQQAASGMGVRPERIMYLLCGDSICNGEQTVGNLAAVHDDCVNLALVCIFKSRFSFGLAASNNCEDWKTRQDAWISTGEEKSRLELFGPPGANLSSNEHFESCDAKEVQVIGNNVDDYKPVARFAEARLTDPLFENVSQCGYDRTTPVQRYTFSAAAFGRDIMSCVQTGSGKTCAFMVPCLESLIRCGPPSNLPRTQPLSLRPCALVLAPTRELAMGIHYESLKLSFDTGLKLCLLCNGVDEGIRPEHGCDILIATVARLASRIAVYPDGDAGGDWCGISLEMVQFLVIDEVDRILDLGLRPQLRQIMESSCLGLESRFLKQSMFFSATFAPEIQAVAEEYLEDYVLVSAGRASPTLEFVTQHLIHAVEHHAKMKRLEKIMLDHRVRGGLAVVFVNSKRAAEGIKVDLRFAGVRATAIHGDKSPGEREESLRAFRSGDCPVLVITDVCARDHIAPNINLVVSFDMPKQLEDYVQRLGCTGRCCQKGTSYAFISESCTYLRELGEQLVKTSNELPCWFKTLLESATGEKKQSVHPLRGESWKRRVGSGRGSWPIAGMCAK